MSDFIQHTADRTSAFRDLTFEELVDTMRTLHDRDTQGDVEFTVIAHGKVKPE